MNNHELGAPITATPIRARLAGHAPSIVQKHWADVDGIRWPVTQAFALAAGEPSVKSRRARRELNRLSFLVGQDAPPVPGTWITLQPSEPAAPASDRNALETQDSSKLTFRYTWLRAGSMVLDARGYPSYPLLPSAPGSIESASALPMTVDVGEIRNASGDAVSQR